MSNSMLTRSLAYADMARQLRHMKKSHDEVRAERARALLIERMGRLRGLPQKVGQMLSMSDDEDRADAFATLNDQAEPLPFDEIRPLLESQWGRALEEVVSDIEPCGIAASLGQVHRATLFDGRDVAIKVQYPEMKRAVDNDLRMLGWLSKPVGDLRRGFDMSGYRAELRRDLDDELDYQQEAAHQKHMQAALASCDGWIVPVVVDELSSDSILVTEWEPGARIDEIAEWKDTTRRSLGRRLLAGFLHALFHEGIIHADPNPGNYRFRMEAGEPHVVLYDYGCVHYVSESQRLHLLKLIEMATNGQGDPFNALVGLGFNGELLMPLRAKLPAVCKVLCSPFVGGNSDPASWRLAERMKDVLGSDRWNFRIAGPPNLIWLLRAFRGVAYYLGKLNVFVSWEFAIRPYLSEYATALQAIDVSSPNNDYCLEGQARHLRIRVMQDGREKVALTFPALAVDDLSQLMDQSLKEKLERDGLNIADFVRRARASGYRPQTIFECENEGKHIAVWLA